MATPVSKNVAAALGLLPTVLGGVRRLPGKAVQLPVIAVGTALSGLDAARREYDDLAERGERLLGRLRGISLDELEHKVEDTLLRNGSAANAKAAVQEATAQVADQAEAAASVTAAVAKAAAPVQETLPVGQPAPARVDSAATPEVVEQVEKIAHNVDAPLITDHDELPLPDYDHMTLGSLRGRLRSLDMQQLVQLRDYEKSKADRLPVVTMLDNRIAKLSNGESSPTGAAPTTGAGKAKPPKKIGTPEAPKAGTTTPPHTKVRST